MGNQISSQDRQNSKLSTFLKSKLKTSSKKKGNTDIFIIKHIQNNKNNNNNNMSIESFDQRRVIFISLMGLYRTWQRVPSFVLYSSLLLMPLKQEWIYQPLAYSDELQSSFISEIIGLSNVSEMKQFIDLLKWKDSQGLVMWMFEDYEYPKNRSKDDLISPFWYHFNTKLTSLYNAVSGRKYDPIKLDEEWWSDTKLFKTKYDTKTATILMELYMLNMKYNTMSEIIYQSNPDSLNPMISYNGNNNSDISVMSPIVNIEDELFVTSPEFPETENIEVNPYQHEGNGGWFISDCYNPYSDANEENVENC